MIRYNGTQNTMNNIHQKFTSVASTLDSYLPIIIERYKKIGKNVFKIHASHQNEKASFEEYAASIMGLTENRVTVVPGTIIEIPGSMNSTVVSMIVTANTKSVACNDETLAGKTLVTANVFQDSDDNIWKLIGEGDAKTLVQVSNDDIDAILEKRLSQRVTANTNLDIDMSFNTGDYIAYYNNDKMQVACGYGVIIDNKPAVFDRTTATLIFIDTDSVVEVVTNLPAEVTAACETASLTASGASKYIEYLRKLYSNTAFMTKMEALIHQRLGLGTDGHFTNTTQPTK